MSTRPLPPPPERSPALTGQNATQQGSGFSWPWVQWFQLLQNKVNLALTTTVNAGRSILLKTNGVINGSQLVLDLRQGSNVTLTDNGAGQVTVAASTSTGTVTQIDTATPITGGPITTTGTIGVDLATTVAVGVVKPDGTTITIAVDGTISAVGGAVIPGPYADDTAAAGAGVAVGSPYYLASGFVVIRLV